MIQIVFFVLSSVFNISSQINLNLYLELDTDNTDPIVFTRYSGGLMFISTRTKSLVYDFNYETIDRYDNKGSLNPLTTYTLTILSNILGNIICIIAVKLTSFSPSLELLAQERMKEKNYVEHLKKMLNVIKCKLILYFIYMFTMMTVYLYFLCAFCSVYKASQWNWFTNGITSNVLSFLTTLGITLLITLCRFIGLHCNLERIDNISLYLNDNN